MYCGLESFTFSDASSELKLIAKWMTTSEETASHWLAKCIKLKIQSFKHFKLVDSKVNPLNP